MPKCGEGVKDETEKLKDICRILFNRCWALCSCDGSMCACCLIKAECDKMVGGEDGRTE